MKKKFIYKTIASLVTASIIFGACTKEQADVKLDSTLSTSQVSNVKSDSATVIGFVVAEGDGFTEKGICYNTTKMPTVANTHTKLATPSKTATFSIRLGGLTRLTTYYARAYAVSASGVVYGEELTFKTTAAMPVLATITSPVLAVSVDKGITATTDIDITDDGGPDATADIVKRGVVYGFTPNPTIDSTASKKDENRTVLTIEGNGKGKFTSLATNLLGNKKYYFRAYATSKMGTSYSNEVNFVTPVSYPIVSTSNVTGITTNSGISGGEVTYDGGADVTARGVVISTSLNPTINDVKIVSGSGLGTFTSNLTGLAKNTTYHIRAFATNKAGTNYGSDISFITFGDPLTWYIPGDYVAASYPGSTFADWSPASSPQIKSTTTAPDKLEGYVYMSKASNNWKFATKPSWDGPNYGDDNLSGVLNASAANNIGSTAGYYKLNVDAAKMTYTAVATVWGVIGSASPKGWDEETALTYDPASKTWKGVMTLTTGEIKFRANKSWDYNYGSTVKDGKTLNAGGDNIAVTAGTYTIVLDLSNPNAYTYSITAAKKKK